MPYAATLAPEAATSDGRKRRVYVAQLLSMVGDQFTLIALPWLVYSESSDPAELGLVLGLLGAPRALTLILGGRTVDRFSAKPVAVLSRGVSFLLLVLLATLVELHLESRWLIYGMTVAIGVASAFTIVSSASLLPSVFRRAELEAANAISQSIRVAAGMFGPLAAAGLIAVTMGTPGTPHAFAHSAALSFAIDAASFLAGMLLLLGVPVLSRTDAAAGAEAAAPAGAAPESDDVRTLLRVLFVYFLANAVVTGGSMQIIVPSLVTQRLGGDASLYGLVMASYGAGSLLGMGLAWRLRERIRIRGGAVLLTLDLLSGFGFLFMLAIGNLSTTIALALLLGSLSGVVQVTTFTWIQVHTAPQRIGRTMAAFLFVFLGLVPLTAPLFGLLKAHVSLESLIAGVGLCQVAISLLAALNGPLRRLRY